MPRLAIALALAACALAACPAMAAPPLEDYGKLPAIEAMRLSPSGDKFAYFVTAGDRRRVVVKKAGGGGLFAINLGALKPEDMLWLGNDHLLVEASQSSHIDLNGDPTSGPTVAVQSTIVDVAAARAANVFRGQMRVNPATFGFDGYAEERGKGHAFFRGVTLRDSGGAIAFDVGRGAITQGHTDLYKVDLETGQGAIAAFGDELHETEWLVDAAGAVVAHGEYDAKTSDWRLYADPKDTVLIAETRDPVGDISIIGQGRTPGTVLVFRPGGADGDFALLEYQPKAGDPGVKPFGDDGIQTRLYDPTTQLLIGGVTNSDNPVTILFDPALQAKFDKVKGVFPGEIVTLVSATRGLDRMILKTVGPGDSGTYFLVDYASKKIDPIGWDYPTILQGAVGESKVVTYKAADGLEMQGILTLPPGREAKNLPVVVFPHGGPEERDYVGFDWWAQAFVSRGYAVFQPNFRGSQGYGKDFRDAGYGQWGRKMQTDISDGLAELTRQGVVDPKRACIMGGSYGGYAALAGVTVQQGLYRCAVSVAGISDLNAFLF